MLGQLYRGSACKLKALYELRQSGRQWYSKIDVALRDIVFSPTNADPCVYMDKEKRVFITVYVDHKLIVFGNKDKANHTKNELKHRFALKDLGDANYCLDIETYRTREKLTCCKLLYITSV